MHNQRSQGIAICVKEGGARLEEAVGDPGDVDEAGVEALEEDPLLLPPPQPLMTEGRGKGGCEGGEEAICVKESGRKGWRE